MPFRSVRPLLSVAAVAGALCCFAPHSVQAQDAEHDWQKQYAVSGKPSLSIETGDASVDLRSCGDCKGIHIRVHSDRKLSDFRLEEHQEGDHVSFLFKDKEHSGIHMNWTVHEKTEVTVETPASLQLDARSGDGDMAVHGISGTVALRSGDGSVLLDGVHGDLHVSASDGSIDIRQASGTLEAHAADGRMKIDGRFSGVQLHSSDGNVELSLAPGSQLSTASRIESADGSVTLRLPHDLAADLDVSAGDGRIDCSLPVTLDHEGGKGHIRSKLNAGGVPLSIRTSDGNVSISAI